MKPAAFDYVAAQSAAHAAALLAEHGGEAKILAGGQSLVPMMNFRLIRPAVLIDITRIPDMAGIGQQDGTLGIGALARHHAVETSPLVARHFPVLKAAMGHVAHLAIRNRGTFGGSLAHADPAAELPLMAVLLEAEIGIQGPSGRRSLPARDFFVDTLTTALEEDEIVTGAVLAALPAGTGWGFAEVARRHGDFAIVAAAALLTMEDGQVSRARLALTGVGATPLRMEAAEALLEGSDCDDDVIAAAADAVRGAIEPNSDLHASADYRTHLAGRLAGRVLVQARTRARGTS